MIGSKFLRAVLFSTACLSLAAVASAQSAPNLLHFQANLKDSSAVPLTGNHSLTVSIWDASSLGNQLWTETQTVTAVDGVVNTLLGATSSLPATIFNSSTRWMEVKVNADPAMTPRIRMASAPYARAAADVPGVNITPNSVTINGLPVINSAGDWVGNPTGLIGPQGPPGNDGADGADGAPGLNGADGADGADGAPGLNGADGADGAPGLNGADGADGAPGADGADGADGAPGLQGPMGINGPKTEDNGLSGWGVDTAGAPQLILATVQPTVGTTTGSLIVYGENSLVTYDAYRNNLTTGVATLLGSGTVNSAVNFTDFSPTLSDYIAVRVNAASASDTVWGAHLNGLDIPNPPVTVFTDVFASAANWTFVAGANNGTVGWSVDATPTTTGTGLANSWQSSPFSLNYNNGVDFNAGTSVINTGAATCNAGLIDLTGGTSATLTFLCAYSTETTTGGFDKRFVEFSNDNFGSVLLSAQVAGTGSAVNTNPCTATTAGIGTWHSHTINLTPSWGAIRMRFRFDTVDGTINTGKGWFVEDATVGVSTGGTPGTAIQRVTPDQFQANDN